MDSDEKDLSEKIEDVLREAGMSGTMKGMWYARYAIKLDVEDPEYVTKALYIDVASHYKTTPGGVERAMRGSILSMWNTEQGPARLSEMAGRPVREKPTNSEFVDLVSYYIRRQK